MSTATAGFYVIGGTLRHDALSYVERRADRELYDALTRREFCYVLTSRQMGKSSLMVRTASHLRREGVAVAVLDLTAVGQNLGVEQWCSGLLYHLGQQLDLDEPLEEFWLRHERLGPMQRWLAALREVVLEQVPGPIVLFIDEIDAVRSLPFSADEFFAGIRECYNRRSEDSSFERLTFCLLGVATPSDLVRDTRMTPFNIGRRIELTDFTEAEAGPLATGLRPALSALGSPLSVKDGGRRSAVRQAGALTESGEQRAESCLSRILHWTNGHPYLTQRLCQAVAAGGTVTDFSAVDELCADLFLSPQARERDDNLLFVRERLLRSEADTAALLELYRQVRAGRHVRIDDANPLLDLLRLSGIVRVEKGHLHVRNQIYHRVFDRQWVTRHMPDAEIRRQRAAFRRGVWRASGIAAVALAVMAGLTTVAVRNGQEARRNLYFAHMNLIQHDWEEGGIARMRESLRQTQDSPERGFEWGFWNRLLRSNLVTLEGHRDHVGGVAFSPDGTTVATSSFDHTARIWDAGTGRLLRVLPHPDELRGVTFSPDGSTVATACFDRAARIWDPRTRREIRVLSGHGGPVRAVAFSPDGRRLVTGGDDMLIRLWDVATGRQVRIFRGHRGKVYAARFSPDGRRIVSASTDFTARVWECETGRALLSLRGHGAQVIGAAFSPDGRRIATSAYEPNVRIWDAVSGKELFKLVGHARTSWVYGVTFSPDGRRILTGADDATARIWDASGGQLLHVLRGHSSYIRAVAFAPDGQRVLTGSRDRTARIWKVGAEAGAMRLQMSGAMTSIGVFSPDGRRVGAGSSDGTANVCDAASGRRLLTIRIPTIPAPRTRLPGGGLVQALAFSPDGRRIATSGLAPVARVWDTHTRRQVFVLRGHSYAVPTVAYSPDGRLLATGSEDATARLWDAGTGRLVRILRGHTAVVRSVSFSPDGRRIATASRDYTARVWETATGRLLFALPRHSEIVNCVVFSSDGSRIATSGNDLTLANTWDADSGRPVLTLRGHTDRVMSIAFSPDGRRLVTASLDGLIKLWDAASGRETLSLRAHASGVEGAAFSPDGNRIVSSGHDGAVRIWTATDVPLRPSILE